MTTASLEDPTPSRFRLLVAILATLVLGCSSDSDPEYRLEPAVPSGTEYIGLSISDGEWPGGELTTVLLAAMPSKGGRLRAPWSTTLKGPVAESTSNGFCIKVPRQARSQRVRLKLPEGTGRFDLARVVVTCEGGARVGAVARRGAVDILRGDFQEIEKLGDPKSLTMDLAELAYQADVPDELDLAFKGLNGTLRIHRVELFQRSIGLRLNAPGQQPVYESIGDAYRPCRALLPGMALSGSWAGTASLFEIDVTAPSDGAVGRFVQLAIEEDGDHVASAAVMLTNAWGTLSLSLPVGGDGLRQVTVTTDSGDGAWIGVPRIRRAAVEPPRAPRHVLLITADTHRADHVGYAPNSVPVSTPTIDALAERGTSFLDAWSVTSITNPSHASILTGEPMTTTGVLGNLAVISERANMLAETFQRAGFRTFASVSARHMTPPRSGFGQGFERFDGPHLLWSRDGAETIERAREMLAAAPDDDVFLWLHLFDVHTPYRVHDEFLSEYYEGDPYAKRAQEIAPEAVASWNRKVQDANYYRALYKNEVTYLDQLLGRFFEENPRARDGWVALTADHGESLGENGLYWTHPTIYPSTVRVPLVFAGPGVDPGLSVDRRVMNLDVARTLLDLCGLSGAEFSGHSLFDEEASDVPRFTLAPSARAAGIESDGWYLVLQLEDHKYGQNEGTVRHAVELYDLNADPDATQNIAKAEHERTLRMRKRLVQWLSTAPEGGVLVGDGVTGEEAKGDMAALGYAASDASMLSGALIDPECACPQCLPFHSGD